MPKPEGLLNRTPPASTNRTGSSLSTPGAITDAFTSSEKESVAGAQDTGAKKRPSRLVLGALLLIGAIALSIWRFAIVLSRRRATEDSPSPAVPRRKTRVKIGAYVTDRKGNITHADPERWVSVRNHSSIFIGRDPATCLYVLSIPNAPARLISLGFTRDALTLKNHADRPILVNNQPVRAGGTKTFAATEKLNVLYNGQVMITIERSLAAVNELSDQQLLDNLMATPPPRPPQDGAEMPAARS